MAPPGSILFGKEYTKLSRKAEPGDRSKAGAGAGGRRQEAALWRKVQLTAGKRIGRALRSCSQRVLNSITETPPGARLIVTPLSPFTVFTSTGLSPIQSVAL